MKNFKELKSVDEIFLLMKETDNFPKNVMYDLDTPQMLPNSYGFEEDGLCYDVKNYCGYVYDEMITSEKHFGPRGEYYHLVLIKDNKIIAFGDEQGNYAGGIYASNDYLYSRFMNEKEHIKNSYPDLYNKIENIPLASENEYKCTL